MRRSLAILCTLAVVLSGCGRGDPDPTTPIRTIEPEETASSPSPQPTADDAEACSLLTSKERASIAGEKINTVAPLAPIPDYQVCRWVSSLSVTSPVVIEVRTTTAQKWARIVPREIDRRIATGQRDPELLEEMLEAKRQFGRGLDELSDQQACDLFELLSRIDGNPKDPRTEFSFGPFGLQTAAAARTCTKGVYTQVRYSEKDLPQSLAVVQAVLRILKIAHRRAIDLD